MKTVKLLCTICTACLLMITHGVFALEPGTLGELLKNSNLDGAYISPNTVTNTQLSLGSVTTDKIVDGSVGANNADGTIQKRVGLVCTGNQVLSVLSGGSLECITPNVCMPSTIPDSASICTGSGVTYTTNVYCDTATVNGTKDCTLPPPTSSTCNCGVPASGYTDGGSCDGDGITPCWSDWDCDESKTGNYCGVCHSPIDACGVCGGDGSSCSTCDIACPANTTKVGCSCVANPEAQCGTLPDTCLVGDYTNDNFGDYSTYGWCKAGTSEVYCSWVTKTAVNGVCGTDNGKTLLSTPTNLCSAGTASTVTGSGPWSWTCAGIYGGNTVTCNALKKTILSKCSCIEHLELPENCASGAWWECSDGSTGGCDGSAPTCMTDVSSCTYQAVPACASICVNGKSTGMQEPIECVDDAGQPCSTCTGPSPSYCAVCGG